ncbi:hypothetical protein MAR_014113, partial [Mya arenaria]
MTHVTARVTARFAARDIQDQTVTRDLTDVAAELATNFQTV